MSTLNRSLRHQANDTLFEGVSLDELAKRWGTPLYVYSQEMIVQAVKAFQAALPKQAGQLFYAVKANSNINLLQLLHKLGTGFDIVSGGELARLQAANIPADQVVYSGVAKTNDEIYQALKANIHCFNLESAFELAQIEKVANHLQCKARIACRLNPDIDANTHPYIATGLSRHKFGLDSSTALQIYLAAKQNPLFDIVGLSCHIGSQIQSPAPYLAAMHHCLSFADTLHNHGINLAHIDIGGGFGIAYDDTETALPPADVLPQLLSVCQPKGYQLYIEPGRSIIGPAGILLTQCIGVKQTPTHQFLFVDTGMHHLLRPALYQATHEIQCIDNAQRALSRYTVVGPICETADTLAQDIELPICQAGDTLAILDAGAYGMSMASHYNAHPLPAEVLVNGQRSALIRARESLSTQLAHELHLTDHDALTPKENVGS